VVAMSPVLGIVALGPLVSAIHVIVMSMSHLVSVFVISIV